MLCLTGIILALLHLKTGSPGLGFAYIQKTIYGGKLFLQPRNRLLVRKVKVEKKDTVIWFNIGAYENVLHCKDTIIL